MRKQSRGALRESTALPLVDITSLALNLADYASQEHPLMKVIEEIRHLQQPQPKLWKSALRERRALLRTSDRARSRAADRLIGMCQCLGAYGVGFPCLCELITKEAKRVTKKKLPDRVKTPPTILRHVTGASNLKSHSGLTDTEKDLLLTLHHLLPPSLGECALWGDMTALCLDSGQSTTGWYELDALAPKARDFSLAQDMEENPSRYRHIGGPWYQHPEKDHGGETQLVRLGRAYPRPHLLTFHVWGTKGQTHVCLLRDHIYRQGSFDEDRRLVRYAVGFQSDWNRYRKRLWQELKGLYPESDIDSYEVRLTMVLYHFTRAWHSANPYGFRSDDDGHWVWQCVDSICRATPDKWPDRWHDDQRMRWRFYQDAYDTYNDLFSPVRADLDGVPASDPDRWKFLRELAHFRVNRQLVEVRRLCNMAQGYDSKTDTLGSETMPGLRLSDRKALVRGKGKGVMKTKSKKSRKSRKKR